MDPPPGLVARPFGPAPKDPSTLGRGGPSSVSNGRFTRQLAPDKGPEGDYKSSYTELRTVGVTPHRGASGTPRRLPMTPTPSPPLLSPLEAELERTSKRIWEMEEQP